MSEQIPPASIIMYICPNVATCGNYYAAPDFRPDRSNINAVQSRRGAERQEETFSRTACPTCRAAGIHIERRPYIVATVVSLETAMHESGAAVDKIALVMGHESPTYSRSDAAL
jgi:hypothetical protein